MCLEFYYHMYGVHIGSLRVYRQQAEDRTQRTQLWQKSGQQGNKWEKARFDVDVQNGNRVSPECSSALCRNLCIFYSPPTNHIETG